MRGTRPGKAALGGIRLPHESPGVGDGYCASGECITRQMTEAERQRYGKAEPNGKQPFVWRKKEDEGMSTVKEKLAWAEEKELQEKAEAAASEAIKQAQKVDITQSTKKISVMELLVEVEVLKNRMEKDEKRIDYISGILEKTMVEA